MLLFITSSSDATANLVFDRCNLPAFRLNFDLWQDYSVILDTTEWEISNPVGLKITDKSASHCFWWKAFIQIDADNLIISEIKYVFRELYSFFLRRGLVIGNPPDFDHNYGKLSVLHLASRYFRTPDSLAGWNLPSCIRKFKSYPIVAKSFSSALSNSNRFLFTTAVPYAQIDRTFPWFLQAEIDAREDVTIFICGDRLWPFSRSRKDLKGLDWRREIDASGWLPRPLLVDEEHAIRALCQDLAVNWGRFDFLQDDNGLVFLEFNANGQWAFLDPFGNNGLIDAVAKYLATPANEHTYPWRRNLPP
jgi:hypothetical protein